jgi:hypothetical protein
LCYGFGQLLRQFFPPKYGRDSETKAVEVMSHSWHFLRHAQFRILDNEVAARGVVYDKTVWTRLAAVLNVWPTTIGVVRIPVFAETFEEIQ